MKLHNDLKIQNKCMDCRLRGSDYFCNFSPATLSDFQNIKVTKSFQKGAHLFVEGQPTDGVYMLCQGRVKLTTHSRTGKSLILRIALPGEVLGLSGFISGSPSETTAEVIDACQVNFIHKSKFGGFLEQNTDAGTNALRQLSYQYRKAFTQIRSLGLSTCVTDKLVALLLEWAKEQPSSNGSAHFKNSFSHEEIAEMIGTSRETVTRTLKDLRVRGLITVKGSEIHIPNTHLLESTISIGK